MITPKDVLDRNRNVLPYERQIDDVLRAPWTEEMKKKGRKVSLRIPMSVAQSAGILEVPGPDQLATLEHVYRQGGWVFQLDPKQDDVWVFEYPKGKP